MASSTTPNQDPENRGVGATVAAERQIDTRGRSLRQHAARGTLINSGFQVAMAGVALTRRVAVAAFLTQAQYGIWGILITTLITLGWLKQIGIGDKYMQQSEPDQERAYQKAFTLELGLSMIFLAFFAIALPVFSVAYDEPSIVVPGLLLALSVPISAFQTPTWIAQRRMQFVRQRVLIAVDPIVSLVVTIVFGVLGYGFWALVIGGLAGAISGAVVATLSSPYAPRLRFDRASLGEYTSFSWPLFGFSLINLVSIQGVLLATNRSIGLAGVGAIALAATIASFADRIDGIINQTIYPAVCAVAERKDLLFEAFVKSNRVSLMWSLPFGAGLALFAQDLVTFLFGSSWESTAWLLGAMGVILGLSQMAFNWTVFMRATNDTRPMFQAGIVNLAMSAALVVPGVILFGLPGYAVGFALAQAVQVGVRGFFLRRLFPHFRLIPHIVRAVAPIIPPVLIVVGLQLLIGDPTLISFLGLLVAYSAAVIVSTYLFERDLTKEMLGYLSRKRPASSPPPTEAAPAA